jgi:hypothetical protein
MQSKRLYFRVDFKNAIAFSDEINIECTNLSCSSLRNFFLEVLL